jgi:anti-sigma B factor antagonist
MRSEALDITIENRGASLWLLLSGPFNAEQAPNIREKILGLLHDGNRHIVLDLERVTEIDKGVMPMLLALFNTVKGKQASLDCVFRNETVSKAFAPYRNIFSIYPSAQALAHRGLLKNIRRQGVLLSRKTGVRLSRPVAIFLLFILCGWFLSLALIIHMQAGLIREQDEVIGDLTQWKQEAAIELRQLEERLRPMEQLGLLPDSLADE